MNTQSVTNTFEPTKVSCAVDETLTATEKKDVKVINTGDIDAFIRAEVVVTWKKQEGNSYVVYGQRPEKGTDYVVSLNLKEDGWVEGNDGFYYFTKAVAPESVSADSHFTDILINSCTVTGTPPSDGYYLSVEIIASAIQAKGESFGAPTGEEGQKPAEIAWTNEKVLIKVNDAATTLTVRNK